MAAAAEQDGTRYLETRATVKAILQDGREVDEAASGAVEVVLDPTPFYGESGGQVGDRGLIVDGGVRLEVQETVKPVEGLTVSRCRVLAGTVRAVRRCGRGTVPEIRKQTRAHHSATHLLHAALRRVLGDHVKQAGSLVDPDHLRFDYSHFEAPTAERSDGRGDANARVQSDDPVQTEVLAFDEAKQRGAIALFGEKYGERGAHAHHGQLDRAVRRHARPPHRRHRHDPHHPRGGGRGRRAPHRGGGR